MTRSRRRGVASQSTRIRLICGIATIFVISQPSWSGGIMIIRQSRQFSRSTTRGDGSGSPMLQTSPVEYAFFLVIWECVCMSCAVVWHAAVVVTTALLTGGFLINALDKFRITKEALPNSSPRETGWLCNMYDVCPWRVCTDMSCQDAT